MGKKGSTNPADAWRKQQKARELKKNAAERKKKREDRTAKQDTRDLEAEIAHLKSRDKLSDEGKERLAKLESELKYVIKLKEKYVAAHPEAKDRVFGTGDRRPRGPREDGEDAGPKPDPMAHLYNPDGTLRDPKKSAYYDPIYNPFGVPPPGMPYRERTPVPGESESSDESDSEDDSDDDIVMPEGPPPGASDSDSDSDSDDSLDIPLPEGPPPPRPPPALPRGGFGHHHGPRGHPRGHPPHPGQHVRPMAPPRRDPANPGGWGHLIPDAGPSLPPGPRPSSLPPRPGSLPAPPSSLPAKPGTAGTPVAAAAAPTVTKPPVPAAPAAPVVISAEPQLRDLRKEATVFVPRGVQKKKAQAPAGLAPVNAAPAAGAVDADGDSVRVKAPAQQGLMGKLSSVLGPAKPKPADDAAEDEYARFLEGLEQ